MTALATDGIQPPRHEYVVACQYTPQSLQPIRGILGALLPLWGVAELTDGCLLIATELCSNTRHTPSRVFRLTIRRVPRGVRIEVKDNSTTLPTIPAEAPGWDAEGGRGLYLASQYADKLVRQTTAKSSGRSWHHLG
jgi:hypothetical protein